MNPFVKIITNLIIFINRLINGLDKKTVEMIKQGYYLVIFLIVLFGILAGYNMGKSAAKKYGTPLAEHTDDIFNIVVKKERDNVHFGKMVEEKAIMEKEEERLKKQSPASIEKMEPEYHPGIVEPETTDRKIHSQPPFKMRDTLADVKKLDEKARPEDVKELGKTERPEKRESIEQGIPETPAKNIEEYIELNPIDKNNRIID